MDIADAQRVVKLLCSAYPNYPVADDTGQLYVEAMVSTVPDPAIAYAVVQDWITTRVLFPAVAELLAECTAETSRRERRAAAIRASQRSVGPDGLVACTNCGDSQYEYHEGEFGEGETYEYVLPCRICDPIRHQDWSEGHIRLDHDVDSCEWELCKRRSKAKSRGRHRTRTTTRSEPQRAAADVGPGF